MELRFVQEGRIEGWEEGRHQADIAWWQSGESQAHRIQGIRTEAEAAELMRRIAADSDKRPCWTALRTIELTSAELDAIPAGTELHYTNWPGRPSVPVTRVIDSGRGDDERGNVMRANGERFFALPDELTRWPRAGLEA